MKSVLRFLAVPLFFLILCVSLTGCGGGDGDNGGGSTPASVPAIPTGITATAGNAKVTVSWNSSTGATSYNIYYATSPGVTKAGAKVANATSPYDVTGLTNGTTYYFVVTAVNSAGESDVSAEKSAIPTSGTPIPAAPKGTSATAGNTQVTMTWTASTDATSYNIYYSTTAGVTKTNGIKVANAVSPHVVTGLTNGTTYYFVVTAVNAAGESDVSAERSAIPTSGTQLPAAPKGTSATAGNTQVTMTWTASTDATSYNIYYSTTAGVTKTNGIKVANAVSPHVVTGLTNGATYYFVVTAVNAAGESEESSENSATPSAGLQPPASPNGVTTTAGTGQVTIQWNTKLTATSYNIYYSSTITTSDGLLSGGTKISVPAASADPQPATQSYVKTGLTAGTTYYFVVTSVNAAGESGAQNFPKTATPL